MQGAPELAVHQPKAHTHVHSLALPPCHVSLGVIASTGGGGGLRLWALDPAHGARATESRVLKGHAAPVSFIHLDAFRFVSCDADAQLRVWDVSGQHFGRPLAVFRLPSASGPVTAGFTRGAAAGVVLGTRDGQLVVVLPGVGGSGALRLENGIAPAPVTPAQPARRPVRAHAHAGAEFDVDDLRRALGDDD